MEKINGVVINQLSTNEDERGSLMEFWRHDNLPYDPVMGYISYTKPNIGRGPHEHKKQTDCFVFIGPGILNFYLWDNRPDSSTYGAKIKIEVGEYNPCLILVPPGVVHGYLAKGDRSAMCLNLPDQLYAGIGKKEVVDEIRHEMYQTSEFKFY